MRTLYIILYILAAVCFAAAAFLGDRPASTRVNLVAAGLFLWVLVPLIALIDA